MHKRGDFSWGAAVLVVCSGCFGGRAALDTRQAEYGLAAASEIGLASSIAMNAMAATSALPCATVSQKCTSYPCNSTVTVVMGGGCPLPLGGTATGSVSIQGTWNSATSSTATMTFAHVAVGSQNGVVTSAKNIVVSQSGSTTTTTYVGQDVQVQGAVTMVGQVSWSVTTTAATPTDPTTYSYDIEGVDQQVSGSSVTQLSAAGVTLSPSCSKNPTAGTVILQNVVGASANESDITFHSSCDGTASEITVGTGSVGGGSTTLALDFLQQ